MKLSIRQINHLRTLGVMPDRGAYPGLNLGTLNSLERRGLVSARHELGSMAYPHVSIKWRLTDAGRVALTSGERDTP
jgi:hypothetical protein